MNFINRLKEGIAYLRINIRYEFEWINIPKAIKPTSKGRWNQMRNEQKENQSRRLGWPSRGF